MSYRSGWCNLTNPPTSHAECAQHPRADGVPCGCDCHVPERVMVTDVAELIDVEYRSPEWYAARHNGISASEIAAVVGLSPWTSAFDLWWLKRGEGQSQGENKGMARGRRYEALILEDFADEHPEFFVRQSVTVRNIERPWQASTPDGLVYDGEEPPWGEWSDHAPIAVIEAKSSAQRAEWGEPGTDMIPVQYRCQVLWQMDTLGLSVAYVPVIFGDQYAEYVVEYDPTDVGILRNAAVDFLASVRAGIPPDIDAHKATTRRLKKLHPSVEPGEVEIPAAVAAQYLVAKRLRDAAEARMRLAENRIRDALGPHTVAMCEGRKVASRSIYDVKPRTQEVKGFTVNKLTFSRPKTESRGTIR